MPINQADVDSLVAAGRYAEAAKLALENGNAHRAADLFEKIWDFSAAADAAEKAGDLPRALRCAVQSRDEPTIARMASSLANDAGQEKAADLLAKLRRYDLAAPLARSAGNFEDAADYFRKADMDIEAADVLVEIGKDREAGHILERFLETVETGDDASRGHLALGALLGNRQQHEAAIRHLQRAAQSPLYQTPARRLLLVQLFALGYFDAARGVLIEARAHDPTLPLSLDAAVKLIRASNHEPRRSQGTRIIGGKYQLGALLGSGAAGQVYAASDEVTGREVAVKILSGGVRPGAPAYERFVREAEVTKSLRHPNIVEVYEFSQTHGFLVMERMVASLREKHLPMSEGQVKAIAMDLLAALDRSHQHGVIHRDIKPANVFFDRRGRAKLGDFGVAHLLDLGETQTGGLIGTLAYMSPEQITGAPLTAAADFYSAGVTLFECLTGRLPFLGPDFVAQHLGEIAPLPSAVVELEGDWDPLFSRLLAKSPDERFAEISDARDALSAITVPAVEALVMPRTPPRERKPAGRPAPVPGPMVASERDQARAPRYQHETLIATTMNSTISRALDSNLNRSVIIERFAEPLGEERQSRLYLLASGGGPFVQRVLSYDQGAAIAVFEAPAGRAIGKLDEPLQPMATIRVLKRLARALVPFHAQSRAHGDISATTVLIDDDGNPTVMVSGISPLTAEPSVREDVDAALATCCFALGIHGTQQDFVRHLVADTQHRENLISAPLHHAQQLFQFAKSLEIHWLRTLASP